MENEREVRSENRVSVDGEPRGADCACALCRELARALPDVREMFRSHARLFRENAELRVANARLRDVLARIIEHDPKLRSMIPTAVEIAIGADE